VRRAEKTDCSGKYAGKELRSTVDKRLEVTGGQEPEVRQVTKEYKGMARYGH
jgi:hypothetical protein